MAEIIPFQGIRPTAERAASIAALPYDVYSREEAAAMVAKNPQSFLCIDRPETNFDGCQDMYGDAVYQKAHDLLWQWVEEGRFIKEDRRCFYIYELTMHGRPQTGIVACASIDDYEKGVIRKHENTREDKEADRIRHVDSCNAQTGPIFLAYRARADINEVVERTKKEQQPLYAFTGGDGVFHRVFRIADEDDIAVIRRGFGALEELYIADGHHRAASAVRVGQNRRKAHPGYTGQEEFNYFLSVLFPHDELMIMDYNRVVRDLNGMSEELFLREVERRFQILKRQREPMAPGKKGEFTMFLGGCWYQCAFRGEDQKEDPVEGLDVSLLQQLLLAPVLGIENPKSSERIDFVGGIRGLLELERRCMTDCKAAFAMYPTSIEELFTVADAGRLMPPKSTWFEPKLLSGLFIHALDG